MKHIQYIDDDPVFTGDADQETRSHIHYEGEGEYTLCGMAWGDQPARVTTEKVNCPRCIRIVIACKAVKASEFIRE